MKPTRVLLVVAIAMLSVPALGAPPRGEAALESLSVAMDLERKARLTDIDELERITDQLGRASDVAVQRRARLLELVREPNAGRVEVSGSEDGVADAEARVRTLETRRSAVVARFLERSRRITSLAEELARRRGAPRGESDPVTGRWSVAIDPGKMTGTYHLRLDGTLISGDYVLAGGFKGSLRGTYVGDRVTLQRIDSERGFDATFYGKLVPSQKRITGSWEATAIAPAIGPSAGTWGATWAPETDESSGENP
ncbi:MAG TPA: hypothetical protein VF580_01850 [Thermoanaerobaculia bacterium]